MEGVGGKGELGVLQPHIVLESSFACCGVVFSLLGCQVVVAVNQFAAVDIVTLACHSLVVECVGQEYLVAVSETDVAAHLCNLRATCVVERVASERERVALCHYHVARCFKGIGDFVQHGTVARERHASVREFHLAAQTLGTGILHLVVAQVVGVNQIYAFFLRWFLWFVVCGIGPCVRAICENGQQGNGTPYTYIGVAEEIFRGTTL